MGQATSREGKRKWHGASPSPPAKRARVGDVGAETSAAAQQRAAAAAHAAAPAGPASRRRRDPAAPATRSAARAPPPLPLYATSADLVVGRYGVDYEIRDAGGSNKQLGRALFASRPFKAGALVARFSGETLHADSIPAWRSCSHSLRVPGSDAVIDGRKLAQALVRVPGAPGAWKPPAKGRYSDPSLGYACMANSAPKAEATAAVRFLCDDTGAGVRPVGYAPAAGGGGAQRLCAEAVRVLPRAAYLVARRDLRAGEEITWHYQVALR